jgi:hypothetical protein
MRPLPFLALFFAALAMASPVEENINESNDPVIPLDEARCGPGYEPCLTVWDQRPAPSTGIMHWLLPLEMPAKSSRPRMSKRKYHCAILIMTFLLMWLLTLRRPVTGGTAVVERTFQIITRSAAYKKVREDPRIEKGKCHEQDSGLFEDYW